MYLGLYNRESLPTLGNIHRFLDNVFGIICQGITPYSGNNTGVWIMYFGLYDKESFPTLGNNTTVWIMYVELYCKESLPTLEKKRCLDNVFGIV